MTTSATSADRRRPSQHDGPPAVLLHVRTHPVRAYRSYVDRRETAAVLCSSIRDVRELVRCGELARSGVADGEYIDALSLAHYVRPHARRRELALWVIEQFVAERLIPPPGITETRRSPSLDWAIQALLASD